MQTNAENIINYFLQNYSVPNKQLSIAFCPYKQEMWDSMASVYNLSKKYSNINSVIIPIPYFSLKPGGMIDSINHDYSETYRKNFPEALNKGWDIICFHYPYDRNNNVTRPLVMSNELKHFCKHLVFIPYAIAGNNITSDNILSAMTGLKNADLICAENKTQKQMLESFFDRHKDYPRPSVEVLGSPKFDYVTEWNGYVPSKWASKIKDRKVVLLQTGLCPMFSNPDKMQQIVFFINKYSAKKDYCLIWRPHPLYREGIISHRSKDLQLFDNLTKIAEESDNIILDKTEDARTALNLAEEMFSDGSSIDLLFEHLGKKVTRI